MQVLSEITREVLLNDEYWGQGAQPSSKVPVLYKLKILLDTQENPPKVYLTTICVSFFIDQAEGAKK